MSTKRYFPLFVDLSDKKVVIVGGGKVATRRVKALLAFTQNITVVAPYQTSDIQALSMAGHLTVESRPVRRSDFLNAFLVLAATDDRKLNETICDICRDEGIFVHVEDVQEDCDFIFPGICIQDSLVVGVTSHEKEHARAKILRASIQKMMEQLPPRYGDEDENEDEQESFGQE